MVRSIVGSTRLERLWWAPPAIPHTDLAVINLNFTYGMLTSARDLWLETAVEGCRAGRHPVCDFGPPCGEGKEATPQGVGDLCLETSPSRNGFHQSLPAPSPTRPWRAECHSCTTTPTTRQCLLSRTRWAHSRPPLMLRACERHWIGKINPLQRCAVTSESSFSNRSTLIPERGVKLVLPTWLRLA